MNYSVVFTHREASHYDQMSMLIVEFFLVDADVTCLCMYSWITFTIPSFTYERWKNVFIYFQFCSNGALS